MDAVGARRRGRAERRQVLAILLAVTAAVVPLAALAFESSADLRSPFDYALLTAGSADVIGPALLVGALGLAVVSSPGSWSTARRTLLVVLVTGAGLLLTGAFLGAAVRIVRPDNRFVFDGDGTGWGIARVSAVAQMAVQGLLCLVTAWWSTRLVVEVQREGST